MSWSCNTKSRGDSALDGERPETRQFRPLGDAAMTRRIHVKFSTCLYATTALSLIMASAAFAQQAPEPTLQEIIVTAQKRASTVQDTPISITAVSGEDLLDRGITEFSALAAATPGISMKTNGPGQTEFEMRGMTSSGGNSPTVGFYLDDVPLTAPAAAQNGKVVIDPTLYDLNRVEVLRGPQGTLYGSGSMGGTVRLITSQPDATAFYASTQAILSGTEGGGFNHTVNAMINIPLIEDKLALRLVGTEAYTSGWIDRIVAAPGAFPLVSPDGSTRGDVRDAPVQKDHKGVNDEQAYAVRATLLWTPTEALAITPSFFYQTSKQNGISAYDSDPGTLAHYQPFDIAEPLTDSIAVFDLNLNYSFDAFDVTSSTAQWNRKSTQIEDASEDFNNPDTGATFASNNGLPNPGYYGPAGSGMVSGKEDDPSHQFSEELRFASKDGGKLKWVAGLYFSDFSARWQFDGITSNPSAYLDLGTFERATTTQWFIAKSPTELKQYAVFGEGTYALTDRLKATLGVRWYSYDYHFASSISGWGSGLGAA